MLCQTCQRQTRCLTHQLAEQDQHLRRMLDQLQGCQRHAPMPSPQSQKPYLLRVIQWMESLSLRITRYLHLPTWLLGKQKP